MFANIYAGRRVLVTGHTGFKGSWLCRWLLELGAQVNGFSLDIPTVPSNFEASQLRGQLAHFGGDIRDRHAFFKVIQASKPEMIFHLAAQSLVRLSYADPILTFETNVLGTLNVLEGLRQSTQPLVGVIITSDKCYQNQEWTWGYRENDVLGGDDPYSASKVCAELIFQAYDRSYFRQGKGLRVATTRAGNVVGGGDWAADRIVPDCVRAWSQGQPVLLRHPQATRPWQHVLEPLSGYLWLGARLWQGEESLMGESFNFGPADIVNHSVLELVSGLSQCWPGARWEVEQHNLEGHREYTLLKLCCDKALNRLGWQSVLSLPENIRLTAEWYRTYYEGGDGRMFELAGRQIREYIDRAKAAGLAWTG